VLLVPNSYGVEDLLHHFELDAMLRSILFIERYSRIGHAVHAHDVLGMGRTPDCYVAEP
jgi:hypothetical protein